MNLPPAARSLPSHMPVSDSVHTTVMPDRNQKPAFGVRVADIAGLKADGHMIIGQRRIPTLRVFDQAFAGFAQGTVFQAEKGFLAIEDIKPGDRLATADGGSEQVTWVGSAMFSPSDLGERTHLTRVMADSFGVNRPESFISLGPAARVLQAPCHLRGNAAAAQMTTPARDFVDGVNVIDVMPPTPIRLFHLGLRSHAALIASGLEVESYHPGTAQLRDLSMTLRDVFLSLFPHLEKLSDFGQIAYTHAPEE